VFTATNEKTTLVGNNEDMFYAGSKVEFHASQDGKYGRVFFGMGRNLHQGGMNEQGLFFDCVAVGPAERTLPKTKAYLSDKGTCTLDLADLFPERHAEVVRNTQAVSREYWKSAKKMDSGQFSKYAGAYSGQGIDIEVQRQRANTRYGFLAVSLMSLSHCLRENLLS
jgi:hypothetical protein